MIQLDFRPGQGPVDFPPDGGPPTIYLQGVSALPVGVDILEYDRLDSATNQPVGTGRTIAHTQRQTDTGNGHANVAFTSIAPYEPQAHGYLFSFTDPDGSVCQITLGTVGAPGSGPTPQDPAHGWGDPNDTGPDPSAWLAATGEADALRIFIDELDVTPYCTNLDEFLSVASRKELDVDLPGVSKTVKVLAPMAGATAALELTVTNARPTAVEMASEQGWSSATAVQRLAYRIQKIDQVLARPSSLLKVIRWPGVDPFGNPGTRVAEAVCHNGRSQRPIKRVMAAGGHVLKPKFTITANSWREETPVSVNLAAGSNRVVVPEFTRGTAPVEDLDISFLDDGALVDHATGVYLRSVAGAVIHCDINRRSLDGTATTANTARGGAGVPWLLTPGGQVSSGGRVVLNGYVRYGAAF